MACRAGQNGRALDLVHLLENETSYIVASRLAAGRNLPSLADHIQTVLEVLRLSPSHISQQSWGQDGDDVVGR